MMEKTVYKLVEALCADYSRREALINEHTLPLRQENELKYYNYKIYSAVAEIVGEDNAHSMIEDIGAGHGYAKCEMSDVSERTYKRWKDRAVTNIALRLYLK